MQDMSLSGNLNGDEMVCMETCLSQWFLKYKSNVPRIHCTWMVFAESFGLRYDALDCMESVASDLESVASDFYVAL